MTPFASFSSDGKDITGGLADRLLSVQCHDEAEDKSDRVTIELDDRARWSDGGVAALPLIGSNITVTLGYREGESATFGPYLIDDLDVGSPPRVLKVTGRAAAMPKSFRTPKTKSYHQKTVGAIMQEIAGRNGYEAKLDPALSGIVMRHIDQRNESDMAFATRLAAMHDGVARPVAGKLAVAKRGTGKSVTGEALATVTLVETDCSTFSFKYSARDEAGEAAGLDNGGGDSAQGAAGAAGETASGQADGEFIIDVPGDESGGAQEKGGVRAFWTDIRTGETKEATAGKEPFHDLRYTHHNEAEAQAAADSYKNKSDRGKASFSCTIGGRPGVQAEAKLILSNFRPYIPAEWRIKTATHTFNASGYSTAIDAELFAEKQADVPAGVKKTKPTDDDKIDPDAPPEPVESTSPTDGFIIDVPS
ncbi:late control protein [Mesorhizobium sp. NZP2234]|uniref:phage late control D family protein n=1 Tax=Mesorhizobium sp. NZP2234 TaxID=2483402 RepID=UPI0015572108|nr:contractile injection system protein, VgrG/Pvc8 family [Mesorhizobium sp. NZP2234]QKC90013.1 late control protein [Mesorhizobium sp. NZP2234]